MAQAILVLGMHRSGTSALTRILSLCGASLPRHLIEPAMQNNEAGFWEPGEIVALHDEILAAAGSSWHDPRRFPAAWFDSAAAAPFEDRLARLIEAEFGAAPLIVMKDPRLCRMLPLWRRVLARLKIEPLAVIAIRHPQEVAASLQKRDGFGDGIALLLWLGHFLAAEHESRDLRRCFVTYDQLLTDGPGVAERIGHTLALPWPHPPQQAAPEIAAFLSGALRHHILGDVSLLARPDLPRQIIETYRWALQAASGEAPPATILDEIRDEIDRAEPLFAPAIDALNAQAQHQSAELRRWIDVAVERYTMIERLFADIGVLQARIEVLSAAVTDTTPGGGASRSETSTEC
ncbi:MAG: hypothetical protein WCC64_19890 [Aliidongia sp.]